MPTGASATIGSSIQRPSPDGSWQAGGSDSEMSTMSVTSSSRWTVDSRVIVYSAIGAALYGILLVAQVPIPGSTVSVRPAFALVPFFGYAFGPVVGFFTGLVGNAIGDQISGWGALTSWNWSIANGLVGLIAGLAPL